MARAIDVETALQASKSATLPLHVRQRLIALVGDDDIVYADSHYDLDSEAMATGQAVVMTQDLVLFVELSQTPLSDHVIEEREGESTVKVRCWPRRSLQEISIHGGSSKDGSPNTDRAWNGEWPGDWPNDAKVALTFKHGVTVTLPLTERSTEDSDPESWDGLASLMRGFIEDLKRP